jgi:hypothetical protein
MNAHCQDTCGEEHGRVCATVENLRRDIEKAHERIDSIETNRNAGRNFFIANGISVLAVLVTLFSVFKERASDEKDRYFPQKQFHGNFQSRPISGNDGADSGRVEHGAVRR